MKQFGGLIEPAVGQGSIEFGETLFDFAQQCAAHPPDVLRIAAGACGSLVVEQYRTPPRSIAEFGKPVAAERDALDGQDQPVRRNGLGEKSVEAGVAHAFALFGTAVGGQRDDPGRAIIIGVPEDLAPGAETVHVGHVQIHQHHVELLVAAQAYRFEPASGQRQGTHPG